MKDVIRDVCKNRQITPTRDPYGNNEGRAQNNLDLRWNPNPKNLRKHLLRPGLGGWKKGRPARGRSVFRPKSLTVSKDSGLHHGIWLMRLLKSSLKRTVLGKPSWISNV